MWLSCWMQVLFLCCYWTGYGFIGCHLWFLPLYDSSSVVYSFPVPALTFWVWFFLGCVLYGNKQSIFILPWVVGCRLPVCSCLSVLVLFSFPFFCLGAVSCAFLMSPDSGAVASTLDLSSLWSWAVWVAGLGLSVFVVTFRSLAPFLLVPRVNVILGFSLVSLLFQFSIWSCVRYHSVSFPALPSSPLRNAAYVARLLGFCGWRSCICPCSCNLSKLVRRLLVRYYSSILFLTTLN